ncbi:MAG TPA: SufS family cysteine desulfurase [Candidatus Babeliales bacterium]|nr:SufS family cysteine desulfurase [Candidatus Babeliales bacterium]
MKDLKHLFPALSKNINGHKLIYFNNAATTHKPQSVIDRINYFYAQEYASIYRGVDQASEHVTSLYESARETVAQFIGSHSDEIIFTRNTTESINFIATAWAQRTLNNNDEIVISQMEHHANLIPWQEVAKHTGAKLSYIPITQDGTLDLTDLDTIITQKTKIVSVVHVSNLLGTHNDIEKIIKHAHKMGSLVLIDAAQSIAHQKINVHELGCDFLAFSGHKILGPTGIGVLYINKKWHDLIPPYQFGGGMVGYVGYEHSQWLDAPQKYEAGTPAIAQAIGLAAALDFLHKNVDFEELKKHESELTRTVINGLNSIKQVRCFGPIKQLKEKGHLVSFAIDGLHAHDIATYLSQYGIAVRAGYACAQPLAQKLGLNSVVRVSFYFYNTINEVEKFLEIIEEMPKNF